ncbi:MAG: hypothetical protein PHO86_04830 [Bacilli bacterium]|nr:hypothetical protein [Bacilli bacterium]
MEMIVCFILGILSQLIVMTSGYRLDKDLNDGETKKTIRVFELFKTFMFIKNKKDRDGVLPISVFYHVLAYFLSFVSIVFFVVAIITNGGDQRFLSVVVSFVLMATSTIILMVEMIIWFIVDIKEGSNWED